jgi:subtilisin-like proprotein convertase family protein
MNTTLRTWLASLLATGATLAGCAAEPATYGDKEESGSMSGGKEDRWTYESDPSRFPGSLEYRLAELPRNGRSSRVAWPSTYWPTYEDSINTRWNTRATGRDRFSPAEKYDLAFNGWNPPATFDALRPFSSGNCAADSWDRSYYEQLGPLARHVSSTMGNGNSRNGRDDDGDGETDECGDNDGVETWWGLCHAWVPASMLEESPERTVTYNGVTFTPSDIQALLIAAYNRSSADMIGGRCNDVNGAAPNNRLTTVERDEHGRPTDTACRDTNAGAFHVIASNYLGIMRQPFAEDRTFDYQVWNQPVVAFDVSKMEEITVARAQELLGLTGDTYTYSADARKLFYVESALTYITESSASTTLVDPARYERQDHYTYILELDAAGKIIGGEYTGSSVNSHPDFLWNPRRITRSSVPSLDIEKVRMLVRLSREPVVPTTGGTTREIATTANVSIPDNDATGITSVASAANDGAITAVAVDLDITHTYRGDLLVTLTHGGVTRTVHNQEGGGADNLRTTLTVTGFEGQDMRGEWTLAVSDRAAQDTGTLNRWTLRVTTSGMGTGGGTGGGTGMARTFNSSAPVAIPDNSSTGVNSTVAVPTGVTARSGAVAVNITHPYVGDLYVRLDSPASAQKWVLHNHTGGDADNIVRTFPLSPAPSGTLAGNWTLRVIDNAAQDVGTINSWSLTLTP